MKVLITSHLFPNRIYPFGGSFVQQQVRFLRRHCDVKLIAPIPWFPPIRGIGRWSRFREIPHVEKWEDLDVFHPRYVTFPRKLLFALVGFFYAFALLKMAHKRDFDLIHAHVAYPDGFAAVLCGRIVHKPVVITAHGGEINVDARQNRIWNALIVWALSHSDRVIAVSHPFKQSILEIMGGDLGHFEVIHNGVDVRLFYPTSDHPLDTWRILYAGRLDQSKGVGILIQAASILDRQRDDFEVVLVGANRRSRSDREFMDRVEHLGLTDRVKFVEAVPPEQMPGWFRSCHVFVLPSFSESFGLASLEAMACGKPVVSTRCGGPEEIVTGEVGVLVPPGDPVALAEAISYVLDHIQDYDPARIAAYVRSQFSLERIAQDIFNVYASVLHSTARKRGASGA